MTSRSTEGHKKVICKQCEVKKVKNGFSRFCKIGSVYETIILISEISTTEYTKKMSIKASAFVNTMSAKGIIGPFLFFNLFYFTSLTNDLLVTFS